MELAQSLGIKEIHALLGSLHPEVNWQEVLQTEVFHKAPIGVTQEDALAKWLENAFKAGKLNPGKMMAALQERVRNPHIRKLPAEIAAYLPPPDQTPPTPPSTVAVDIDSNILTDSDDWSSTTSLDTNERLSLMEEVISLHLDQIADEKLAGNDNADNPSNVDAMDINLLDGGDIHIIDPAAINGRMLKAIIDQPEFQRYLQQESTTRGYLFTSEL